MVKKTPPVIKLLILALFIFSLSSCTYVEQLFKKREGDLTAAELMEKGEERLSRGYFGAAAGYFQMVKDRYPYSRQAITAKLKMADAFYQSENYDEAFWAYDEFERLHPKNANIPYVIYQKGMCYFQQMSTIDRDQSQAMRAKEEFERLINRFPRDDYANLARNNLRKCLISLAEYELYVGHFYYRMGEYRAALGRYTYIIENYADMGQYHEALEYIGKCNQKIAQSKKYTDAEEKEERRVGFWRRLNPFN